mmetsp:Transcript_81521/g.226716  ORF Transcript_81521/g.226716 Transcript_81521/m.226716 type:complete len:213 (-) Transcript_81521:183-821(-)
MQLWGARPSCRPASNTHAPAVYPASGALLVKFASPGVRKTLRRQRRARARVDGAPLPHLRAPTTSWMMSLGGLPTCFLTSSRNFSRPGIRDTRPAMAAPTCSLPAVIGSKACWRMPDCSTARCSWTSLFLALTSSHVAWGAADRPREPPRSRRGAGARSATQPCAGACSHPASPVCSPRGATSTSAQPSAARSSTTRLPTGRSRPPLAERSG